MGLTKDLGALPRAITVDSSNNVGVGTISPIASGTQTSVTINSNAVSRVDLLHSNSKRGLVAAINTQFSILSQTAIPLVLGTNDIGRALISPSGDFRINHDNDFNATFSVKKVAGRNIANFSNEVDADFTITTSEVGGATRFATITPTVSGQQLRIGLNNNNVLIGTTTDNGSRLQVNGNVSANTFFANADPGNPSVDSSGRFINLANGAFIDFPSMSGMIIVNNTGTGAIQAFLCGGGNTTSLGFATGTTGSMAHSPSVGGYRFTNNTGSAWVFSFQVLKTRQTA
jgi:hypothetical protein